LLAGNIGYRSRLSAAGGCYSPMSSARVIKKYPNRRLYDTEESRYITLADVKDLVLNKVEFVVIDKKSGDDITRAILLQVIRDQEQNGDAVMTEGFLAQIIRSYGTVAPGQIAEYLEHGLDFLLAEQNKKPLTSGG